MEIKHTNDNERGYFKAEENGVNVGLMSYINSGPQKIAIDHTEVNPNYSGQGVGLGMVMEAVDYARKNDIKILPLCPFAKNIFNKTPEIRDVLEG